MTHLFQVDLPQVDASGIPYAGQLLYFYATGTTTPITTYQDSGKVTPSTTVMQSDGSSAIVADSKGSFVPIYVDTDTYKITLKTAALVTTLTIDPITALVGTAQAKFGDGAVSLPSITFTADPDTGIWRVGSNEIGVSLGGFKFVDITASLLALNLTSTAPATAPLSSALQVIGNAQTGYDVDVSSSATAPGALNFRKSGGTQASKSAVLANYQLGVLNFYGADTTSYAASPNGYIRARVPVAETTWTASTHATEIAIGTTPTGSTSASNEFVFGSDGYLRFTVQAVSPTVSGVSGTGIVAGTGGFPYWLGAASTSSLGLMDAEQFATVVTSAVSLSNSSTSAQAIFASANDSLVVAANMAYFFEAYIYLSTGTTSHTTAFGLGGTATYAPILYDATLVSAAATTIATSASFLEVTSAAATVLNAASTAAVTKITLRGMFRTNAGGTLIPQITFSAGPTGTCQTNINSWFRIWPAGADTIAAVGPWS